MTDTPKPNIYQRVAAIMADVRGVEKSSYNSHANYKFAGHEAVTAALRVAYLNHGVVRSASVTDFVRGEEPGLMRITVDVVFTNIDDPNDYITQTMVAEAPSTTGKKQATAQQTGVALSYAVKNAEFKLFSLTGDNTPDADEGYEPEVSVKQLEFGMRNANTMDELNAAATAVKAAAKQLTPPQAADLRALYTASRDRIGGAS